MRAKPKKARALHQGFLLRLERFRVLDPACGSGNFLYLALAALRDVEKRAHVDAQELGLGAELVMHTGPHNILGLEINEFAAELARVTVWIGDIQWCRRNGYQHAINPILKPLDGIEHRDALLNPDGSEAEWPAADVITGNPPFVGDKLMRARLGAAYVEALRKCFEGRVPGGADFVTYWFEKGRAQIAAGQTQVVGLVATDSIRGGANRKVLERIADTTRIFEAWSSEHWVNEGAAVRVSLIGFGPFFGVDRNSRLDGAPVSNIHADLTAGDGLNLISAKPLPENAGTAFQGITKGGPFEIPGEQARDWLRLPNPNGRSNANVVCPWRNGMDVTRRSLDRWIVDFAGHSESDASLFEVPFSYTRANVKPERDSNSEKGTRENYWLFKRSAAEMKRAIRSLPRSIGTPEVAKHRVFVWLAPGVVPDKNLIVIARADDSTFGILHSRFHELWSLRLGTSLEDRPRYTNSTTFETFPAGLTPRDTAPVAGQASPPCLAGQIVAENIAAAAHRLNELREAWLNPPEWVDWVSTPEEEKAGFPKRPVAKPGHEADLKKRTLTNLYNARPAWLDLVHKALDQAVAAAYGWDDYTPEMPDDEILRRLLALNLERSKS
jgi:type II restriction/modification system DNA methylase subunit YeeA